jgi:hypothetical protein
VLVRADVLRLGLHLAVERDLGAGAGGDDRLVETGVVGRRPPAAGCPQQQRRR